MGHRGPSIYCFSQVKTKKNKYNIKTTRNLLKWTYYNYLRFSGKIWRTCTGKNKTAITLISVLTGRNKTAITFISALQDS